MYQTGATNESQTDDNELFNEYNGDDKNQADYPILSNDDVQAFICF